MNQEYNKYIENTKEYYDFLEVILLKKIRNNLCALLKKYEAVFDKAEKPSAITELKLAEFECDERIKYLMVYNKALIKDTDAPDFEMVYQKLLTKSIEKHTYFPMEHLLIRSIVLVCDEEEIKTALIFALRYIIGMVYFCKNSMYFSKFLNILSREFGESDKLSLKFLLELLGYEKADFNFITRLEQSLSIFFPFYSETKYLDMDDILNSWLRLSEDNNGVLTERGSITYHYSNSTDLSEPMYLDREKNILRNIFSESGNSLCQAVLFGEEGTGKKTLINNFSDEKGISVIYLDLHTEKDIKLIIKNSIREALIFNMIIAVTNINRVSSGTANIIKNYFENCICSPALSIIYTDSRNTEAGGEMIFPEVPTILMPVYSYRECRAFWEKYMKESSKTFSEELSPELLASAFVLTPGQIRSAVCVAETECENKITRMDIYSACRRQQKPEENESAALIKSLYSFEDLILDKSVKEILRLITASVSNQVMVMEKWGFSQKLPYGAGLAVLFYGPPGTGKTMAAQVLANELHMELYKVDTSRLVDKYVGETEKNIKAVFRQASKGNYILFFDEADAIFNKRMDATNANERFANIESALLLQCMEEYGGLSILATNLKNSMDNAFFRRFKYAIRFDLPNYLQRMELWKKVFPEMTPLSDEIDFEFIADKFDFSGAEIKNVAVSSAYIAARDNAASIEMKHIMKAIRYELQKQGQTITEDNNSF